MNLCNIYDIISAEILVDMIIERTNAIAIAFSPIDNMENFTTSFYYAIHKLKAYLSDPTSNASVMRKMVELSTSSCSLRPAALLRDGRLRTSATSLVL